MGFATFSDESLIWFRACELKHSRVAMLACAGWIVNGLHLSLPGTIDYSTKFSDLAAKKPLDAWAAVPVGGKLQILGWIFCVECASEMQKPHYLKGGEFVTYDWANQASGRSLARLNFSAWPRFSNSGRSNSTVSSIVSLRELFFWLGLVGRIACKNCVTM